MSAATKARTAGVISAAISGGTIIGLAIVDDMIVHVVAEYAVPVQISFFPGRLPGFNKRERWRAANEQRPFVRDAAACGVDDPAAGRQRHSPVAGRRLGAIRLESWPGALYQLEDPECCLLVGREVVGYATVFQALEPVGSRR